MRISDWSADVCSSDLDVVMLEEGGRRQHDVGHGGGLGEERLVKTDEQVAAGEAALDGASIGRDLQRIRVLDVERRHRRAVTQVPPVAAEDGADARHVEERSAERRVGKECVRKCRSRWSPDPQTRKKTQSL